MIKPVDADSNGVIYCASFPVFVYFGFQLVNRPCLHNFFRLGVLVGTGR